MDKKLEVVILEDRRQDAVLIVGALREYGYAVDWTCVGSEAEFRDALENRPDVILADYQLPGFDAMAALEIAREIAPRTPFIVVTGALGDEAAAACIRSGATDYILKDRLARLGSSVEAALEQRRLRDLQQATLEALIASERRFRSVFVDSPVGMVVLSPKLEISDANPAFCAMLGIGNDGVLGSRFPGLFVPDDTERIAEMASRGRDVRREPATTQARLKAANADVVWVQVSFSSLEVGDDGPRHILAIVEDINDRIIAQESARSREAILHAVGRGAELFLGDGAWDEVVGSYLEQIGRSAGTAFAGIVMGCSGQDPILVHRWDATDANGFGEGNTPPLTDEAVQQWIRSGPGNRVADGVYLMSGPAHVVAPLTLIEIVVRQRVWGYLAVSRRQDNRPFAASEIEALRTAADLLGDAIMDRDAAAELRASEERTRLIVDTALDAVISLDGSGRVTGWNAQASCMFGWTPEEAVGRTLLELVVPIEAREEWMSYGVGPQLGVTEVSRPSRFETIALRRDGVIIPAEVAVSRARFNGSMMLSLFVRDLRPQKNAEFLLGEARRQDVAVASRIQKAMLVGDPPIVTPRLSIASETQPGELVAGDFVASLRHDEDTIDVVIGDVMGKGSNAALLGAITKGYIYQATRTLALHLYEFNRLPAPHEVVYAVHSQITPELQKIDSFVTLMYARFDLRSMRCTLIDCGHTRSVHYRFAEQRCDLIQGDNMPLGVAAREFFAPLRVPFGPGDVFFFYSDGVIEAESPTEEQFGEARMVEAILSAPSKSPAELIGHVLAAVDAFRGDRPPSDDITCVAVTIGDAPIERPTFQRAIEIPGTLDELEPVRQFVERFCREMPGRRLPDEDVEALKLAAHEATCNIIGHAHEWRADIPVQILAEAYDDRVELRLFDIGRGFDIQGIEDPRSDGTQPSGYGIFLMRQLVRVDYRRDDLGRNYFCLVKPRPR